MLPTFLVILYKGEVSKMLQLDFICISQETNQNSMV